MTEKTFRVLGIAVLILLTVISGHIYLKYNLSPKVAIFPGEPNAKIKKIMSNHGLNCAILENTKGLWCWGDAYDGYSTILSSSNGVITTPIAIFTLEQYKDLSFGGNIGCAITLDDRLRCWDSQTESANNNNFDYINLPEKVTNISADFSACAILKSGRLFCWGLNDHGQVGNGSLSYQNAPVEIDTGVQYQAVVTSFYTTCGITSNKVLKCWGNKISPEAVNQNALLPEIKDKNNLYSDLIISSGKICALSMEGKINCWEPRIAQSEALHICDSVPTDFVTVNYNQTITALSNSSSTICGKSSSSNDFLCWKKIAHCKAEQDSSELAPKVMKYSGHPKDIFVHPFMGCMLTDKKAALCWGITETGAGSKRMNFPPNTSLTEKIIFWRDLL